jgi:UDP-3-O-[3-hydroxymyristoyl] glucosamine N-acyltransferase
MILLTLKEVAEITQSTLIGDPEYQISGISNLENATASDLSFFEPPTYLQDRFKKAMEATLAGAILIKEKDLYKKKSTNYLINKNPSKAFQVILNLIHEKQTVSTAFKDIHPTAVVHESVTLGENITVHPHVVIDKNVTIGAHTTLCAGTYIGTNVTIGTECYIHPNVTIREGCQLDDRVIIQPGAVIGSCGFGYTTTAKGKHEKLSQVGTVLIESDVEIGANTTIDRARFGVTLIQKGTKIDNLVQIAHGVNIENDCLIVSQVGIAGSAEIGHHTVLAGQSAVVGHIKVPPHSILAAKGGFSKTLPKGGQYGGAPAIPIKEYRLREVHARNLDKHIKKIKELEKRIALLESE